MILELQRAERVRDALDRVRQRVREVVHRVDAPGVAGAVVRRAPDAVERRVAHVDVGRRHVDLRPQRVGAVRELARAHPAEQIEVLRDGPVPVRALAPGLGQRAAVLAHLLGRQVVDVGQALLDELLRPEIELLEVVGRVELAPFPVESEPAHVFADGIDVLDVLLRRVRVVEPRLHLPPNSSATPKFRQIDLAWPMCR